MDERRSNRVRELREARGLSQVALATAASLTRQSVGSIEAGRTTPAVDVALRLARALECTVEDLFDVPAQEAIATEPVATQSGDRVALAHVGGRWVSYPLLGHAMRSCADGLAGERAGRKIRVEPVRPPSDARENLVVMGCATALGLVVDRLNLQGGRGRFLWVKASSTTALEALAKRRTHVAGAHLVDPRTGEENVADVRRHAGADPVVLVTLARWEAGLITSAGNPKRIRGAADLARRGLRLVTRERGSGARRLLERELRAAGAPCELAAGSGLQATGHLEAAHAVAIGAAGVGIATRDAAIAYGLGFVPLAQERYDLVLPTASLEDPRVQRFLDLMTTSTVRRELASLGYDVRSCGDRVAEVAAA